MTNYLDEINNLLASSPLVLVDVKSVYHSIILDNATFTVANSAPDKLYKYVEDFIANCIYLLDLSEDSNARNQLEAAKKILLNIH